MGCCTKTVIPIMLQSRIRLRHSPQAQDSTCRYNYYDFIAYTRIDFTCLYTDIRTKSVQSAQNQSEPTILTLHGSCNRYIMLCKLSGYFYFTFLNTWSKIRTVMHLLCHNIYVYDIKIKFSKNLDK